MYISLVYWSLWSDSFLGAVSHLDGLQIGGSGAIVETLFYCDMSTHCQATAQ
jgi:hypothetical protein